MNEIASITDSLALRVHAQQTAFNSLTLTTDLQRDVAALSAFEAVNGSALDYDDWKAAYTDERNRYVNASNGKLKSVAAAKAATAPQAAATK